MTENEAKKHLELCKTSRMFIPNNGVLEVAIQALEKVQAFEAIGTIEDFKALKEKSVAKKAIVYGHNDAVGTDVGLCPVCNDRPLRACDNQYCPDCGQKLDWSE